MTRSLVKAAPALPKPARQSARKRHWASVRYSIALVYGGDVWASGKSISRQVACVAGHLAEFAATHRHVYDAIVALDQEAPR